MHNKMEDLDNLNKYDSLARTIQTSEITSNERNARIIIRLRNQDPDFTKLALFEQSEEEDNYVPESRHDDLVWLGYFIGSNTQIGELVIADNIQVVASITREQIKLFLEGVNKNKSVKQLILNSFGHHNFQVHDLKPLIKDNINLESFILYRCVLDHQAISLLQRTVLLEDVKFDDIQMTGVTLSRTLDALGMLPLLQTLELIDANIGVNECRQIAAFLGRDSTNLVGLNLSSNSIDDEAVEVLVLAISRYKKNLQVFNLSNNTGISAKGQRAVSALLKSPNCSLKALGLEGINMDNEGAQLFAEALTNNKSSKCLGLDNNDISATGWAAFSRILCDTSSVNKTYCSNQTLYSLRSDGSLSNMPQNEELSTLVYINWLSGSRHQAAVLKILRSHPDLNMEPLFEWDFKLMPYVLDWLEEAGDHASRFSARMSRFRRKGNNVPNELTTLVQQCQQDLPKRKLSSLYQFIKGMPGLYIESRLLQQLNETQALKVVLQHQLEQAELREQRIMTALQSRQSSHY